MKDKIRWLKVRVREGFKDLRTSSEGSESSAVDDRAPSEQSIADSQQIAAGSIQQEDQTEATATSGNVGSYAPLSDPTRDNTASFAVETVDISGWADIWVDAYKKAKTNPEHPNLLAKLEMFLEKGEGTTGFEDDDNLAGDLPATDDNVSRLKTIQKIAEEKLKGFSEAHLSFTIGQRPIVVRQSIIKAVKVINTLKPIISGAVAAEPTAALAWAGVTNVLPILESIFQQDEDAATGLTEITFLMARYQMFHETDFASELKSISHSAASQELLNHVKDELISIYAQIYIYEARFILQYASRKKLHRVFRNTVNADNWKVLWSEIQSTSSHIDQGIRDQIGVQTLRTWDMVKSIQMSTERIEAFQYGTLKAVQDVDRRQLLQSLKVTGNAIFDSRQTSSIDAPCLPGTQRQILKTIQDWIEDSNGEMIFWLEGMAGTGKTSISMTIASALKEGKPFTNQLNPPNKAFLGASFFFKQGDATRNNTVEFFTTIAWCLSVIFPGPGSHITKAIKDNPGIDTKSAQQQFRKLIVEPLSLLDKNTFMPLQLLVVIDALDECDDNDAETLLGLLGNLENLQQVRLRLFVTSRREGHISMSFKGLPSQLYRTVRLEKIESSPGEDNDITFYLSETLKGITKRYGAEDGGVSDADINKLAEKAEGLFIYAVTACRFLDSPNFVNKKFRDIRLNLIFEEVDGPQQEVDGIYLKVLRFPDIESLHERLRVPFYFDISRLIGFIVVLLRPASVETLYQLLPATRADLDYLLGHLHPIVNVPEDPRIPITLIHLSFRDFILNEKRSKLLPFSIKELAMHQEIFNRCLELMNSELHQNICRLTLPGTFVSEIESSEIQAHIPQYLQYACLYWVSHLSKTDYNLEDNGLVHAFLREKLLYWLEVMAFIGEAPSIVPIISQLEILIHASENPDLLSLVHDAKRFVQSNRWIIEKAPLQMYCSALLFCPSKSIVRYYYQYLIPDWIVKKPEAEESWRSELYTLQGHSGNIFDFAFSPSEVLLASVSRDNTTRVWDYITGSELYRFEDLGTPGCICFSMDGLKLASGCFNGTICVRDLRKGTDISFSCQSKVVEISFSPTASNILASICDDGKLRIWNLDDKQQGPVQHAWEPYSLEGFVFSPNGQLIAVRQDNLIAIFHVEQADQVNQFRVRERITTMAFSIDSTIMAVRLYDSIDFWDIALPDPRLVRSYEATWSTYSSFLFLPSDEKLSLHEDDSSTIELCDTTTGYSIGKFSKNFGGSRSRDGVFRAVIARYNPLIQILNDPSSAYLYDELSGAPDHVEFLFDDTVSLSYLDQGATKKWNVVDGCMQQLQDYVRTIKYSPDQELVLLQLNDGDEFQVWDKTLTHLLATFHDMADITFIPHTNQLASLSLLGEFQVLSLDAESRSFKPIWSFGLQDVVFKAIPDIMWWKARPLHLSPSGQEAVVKVNSSRGESCQLWNLAKKKKVKEVLLPNIYEIIFSPANDFFGVEYSSGGNIRLFHMSSGEEVHDCDLSGYASLTFHPADCIFAVISKDQQNSISIWEGLPWMKKLVLEALQDRKVRNLALSATGKIAALSTSSYSRASTIDVWDIATKQKIGSQVLEFSGFALSFYFSAGENFFESNRGRLPVPIRHTPKEGPEKPSEGMHNCLYVLDEWVFQGYERLIWLPPSYRPRTTRTRNVDVRGGIIALAHGGNSVKFIGVSLERTPIVKSYIG